VSSQELTQQNCLSTNIDENNVGLLSINKASKKLKVRYGTVKRLIEEGKIEVIIIGKRTKISMTSLKKFIEENSRRITEEVNEQHLSDSRDIINNKVNSIIKKHTRRH
jgi:excisionase family DNA binding protein